MHADTRAGRTRAVVQRRGRTDEAKRARVHVPERTPGRSETCGASARVRAAGAAAAFTEAARKAGETTAGEGSKKPLTLCASASTTRSLLMG